MVARGAGRDHLPADRDLVVDGIEPGDAAACLSCVRRETHARFRGGGYAATCPRYPAGLVQRWELLIT